MPLPSLSSKRTVSRSYHNAQASLWPLESCAFTPAQPPPHPVEASSEGFGESPPVLPPPQLAPYPILWGDWPRCHIRRQWIRLLRTQTVTLTFGSAKLEEKKEEEAQHAHVQTRAQRAHWRLSWHERMARNARLSSASPLEVTLHGRAFCFCSVLWLGCGDRRINIQQHRLFLFSGSLLAWGPFIFISVYVFLPFHSTFPPS